MKVITIAGNLGRDAELRQTGKGDKVTGFSVAVEDRAAKETFWFDCSIWGKRGESLAQYLKKGTPVTVTGTLTRREHEGKTYLGVRVSDIALQGRPDNSGNTSRQGNSRSQGGYDGAGRDFELEDDIPF